MSEGCVDSRESHEPIQILVDTARSLHLVEDGVASAEESWSEDAKLKIPTGERTETDTENASLMPYEEDWL